MLAQIDWARPWYDAVRPAFERLALEGDEFLDAFNRNAQALGHEARRAWLDGHVASQLVREGLSTAAFTPLQALGVPGWWPGQDAAFYLDTTVFRPKRADRQGAQNG